MIPTGFRGTVRRAATGFLLALAVAAFPSAAALRPAAPVGPAPSEYDLKAVFLYNFTRYLQWPEEDATGAFEIAVLGDSGIVAPLQEIAAKKTVRSAPIVVRRCEEPGQIGRPRILFLARPAAPSLKRALNAARGAGILTVGEEEGLAARGAAVNFVLREETVKFEVSVKALKAAGIQAGSQLLKLAIRIGGERPEDGR